MKMAHVDLTRIPISDIIAIIAMLLLLGNLVKPRLKKIRLEAERAHEVAQKFCKGWNELNQIHVDLRTNLPMQIMHDVPFVISEAD